MGENEARPMNFLLYLVADPELSGDRPYLQVVAAALSGGVCAVQLRDKHASARELLLVGKEMRRIAHSCAAAFLVNDRPDVALALEADGVHVGPEDLPPGEARRLIPKPRLLGVSVRTLQEALSAQESGADYLGVGPIFPTTTKKDAGEPLGLGALTRITASVRIPVIGIGGIDVENAASVIEAGCAGIAVVSALMGAADPERAARTLRAQTEEARDRVARAGLSESS
jgi:thiamine-phosphate pyrophosphorylase